MRKYKKTVCSVFSFHCVFHLLEMWICMVVVMVLCAYVLTFRQILVIIIWVNIVNTSKGITVMKIIVKLPTMMIPPLSRIKAVKSRREQRF